MQGQSMGCQVECAIAVPLCPGGYDGRNIFGLTVYRPLIRGWYNY